MIGDFWSQLKATYLLTANALDYKQIQNKQSNKHTPDNKMSQTMSF